MTRHLVTAQEIENLTPIPDADRIETARIKGWNVVVPKGQYNVGDVVGYFETDSFLPATDERYQQFLPRGTTKFIIDGEEVEGHVLRTAKLRGQISQGLIMSLDEIGVPDDTPIGTDITKEAGVVKYEAPLPVGNGEIIGPFDTLFAPKTDAERLQNLSDHWDEIKELEWTPTLKVDGTSQTLINDNGKLRIFSRNWELDPEGSVGFKVATDSGIAEALEPGMAVQFELCGPGIQSNRLRLSNQRPFVFSLYNNGERVPRDEYPSKLAELSVPVLSNESVGLLDTIDESINQVDGLRETVTKGAVDEGVVYHLADPTKSVGWLDRNQSFKIINNKYLLKYGL